MEPRCRDSAAESAREVRVKRNWRPIAVGGDLRLLEKNSAVVVFARVDRALPAGGGASYPGGVLARRAFSTYR